MKQPSPNSGSASRRRKWLFRLIALALVPALLLLLEIALRVFGYGHATDFFAAARFHDRDFLVNNEDFSLRFFSPELARWPEPILMPAVKPAGVCRIFIFGESAAMGDPEPLYGAGRYLEVLLREKFPEQKFEVVNVAFTAINSNVILPIARDCARQHGDVWIIYMGNNEMVGPFGAATVFGAKAPPRPWIRLSLAIGRTRVGQLMSATARKLAGKSSNAVWGGMQMFLENQIGPNDPRKETVYRNFQSNLRDIVQAGLHSAARVVLNTVAVNLKDCPPLATMSDRNLPPADRVTGDSLFAEGTRAAAQADFATALQRFSEAARLDPRRADLQFNWGECLLRLTNFTAAREHFQLACDADALPFRADSRINDAIRRTAGELTDSSLVLLDAEEALTAQNPTGICGGELFYEHVHFNFDGNYLLARAWAAQVESALPAATRGRAAGDWASQELCERRLGLTDWNRSLVLQSVLKRFDQPPLNAQPNNPPRQAALRSRVAELRRGMDAASAAKARAVYEEALKHAPEDAYVHESFSEFLQATGDLPAAVAERRKVRELSPFDYLADYQLGRLLCLQGQWAEARASLDRVLARRPHFAEAWFESGNVRFGEGEFARALDAYDRARQLQPNDPRVWYQAGKALSVLKRPAESIENFQRAVQLKPDYWEAHYVLGGELGMHDRVAEAKTEFETVVRLQPDYAMGHLNLGVALMKLGQLDEAQRQFEETLRLDAHNKLAQDYLGRVRNSLARRGPGEARAVEP